MLEFLLCLLGGVFGAHKFYRKDWTQGLLYFFTVGLFGVGWIKDTVLLGMDLVKASRDPDYDIEAERLARQEKAAEARALKTEQRRVEREAAKERIRQLDRDGVAYCPRCKSTSIQYVERKKQLSIGRGLVGGALFGRAGAAVGAMTSKKYKGFVKCLKCGRQWKN